MKFLLLALTLSVAFSLGTITAGTVAGAAATYAANAGTVTTATCSATFTITNTYASLTTTGSSKINQHGVWVSTANSPTATTSDFYFFTPYALDQATDATHVSTTFTTSPTATVYQWSTGSTWVLNSTATVGSATASSTGTVTLPLTFSLAQIAGLTNVFTKTSPITLYYWNKGTTDNAAGAGAFTNTNSLYTGTVTDTLTLDVSACLSTMKAIYTAYLATLASSSTKKTNSTAFSNSVTSGVVLLSLF